jgi:hypothetical protein
MAYNPLVDSILATLAMASTILLLGGLYLMILRAPKFQYSLRFLLLSIGGVAAVIGLWAALLRTPMLPALTRPGMQVDQPAPADFEPEGVFPSDELNP